MSTYESSYKNCSIRKNTTTDIITPLLKNRDDIRSSIWKTKCPVLFMFLIPVRKKIYIARNIVRIMSTAKDFSCTSKKPNIPLVEPKVLNK